MSIVPSTWEDCLAIATLCSMGFGVAIWIARLSLRGMFVTRPEHLKLDARLAAVERQIAGLATREQLDAVKDKTVEKLDAVQLETRTSLIDVEKKVASLDASVLVLREQSRAVVDMTKGNQHLLNILVESRLRDEGHSILGSRERENTGS